MNADCLFCRIVAGEIPSTRVLDTPEVYAFRDISPSAPVHVLVVPKTHVADIREVGVEHGGMLAALMQAVVEVARLEGVAESGYRTILNIGPDAGQSVLHLHMHVVGGAPLGPVART